MSGNTSIHVWVVDATHARGGYWTRTVGSTDGEPYVTTKPPLSKTQAEADALAATNATAGTTTQTDIFNETTDTYQKHHAGLAAFVENSRVPMAEAIPVFRPEDYNGVPEIVEIATVTSGAVVPVTLTGDAASGIKLITIRVWTTGTATMETLYAAFTGTAQNDVETTKLRHLINVPVTLGVVSERTWVFEGTYPTGINLLSNDAVGTGHQIVVEVTYV